MNWWSTHQLKSNKPDARIAAIRKLTITQKVESIGMFAEMVGDPDPSVRQAVAEALSTFRDERVVIPLSILLNDTSPAIREAAAIALGDTGLKRSEKQLLSSLKDSNAQVRRAAARSLELLGWQPSSSEERAMHWVAIGRYMQAAQEGETAFIPLLAVLQGDTYQQRKAAVEALSRLDDERAIRPLIAALKDSDSHVRVSAVEAIGRMGNPEAVDAVISALKDEFPPVRVAAAEVLGRIGGPKVFNPLTVALRDKSWDVRRSAVEALGRLGDERVIDPLLSVYKDNDTDVRMAVVRALAALQDPRAIPALIITLTDEQRPVREAAVTALLRIDQYWDQTEAAQSVMPELEAAQRSREYWVRQAASDVLTRIEKARVLNQGPEEEASAAMAQAPLTVQLLVGLLRDSDRDFRLAAAEALGRLGDVRVETALGLAQQDIDPWVQAAAGHAWEAIQHRPVGK